VENDFLTALTGQSTHEDLVEKSGLRRILFHESYLRRTFKKKRCNQLSADQIMDIFRCSPLDHNITGVVKKVVVNARVVHLADFYGVGQSTVHDIFQMRGARVIPQKIWPAAHDFRKNSSS